MNKFLKQTRLIFFALLLLVTSASYGQSPCGNVSTSVGFPNPGCEFGFVAGDYLEVSTASAVFVDSWEYSYDGGGSFTTIIGSGGNNQLPFGLLNGIGGNPSGVVFRLKYNAGCAFGYSNNSGAYSILPKPVAGTFATTPSSLCSYVAGPGQQYALTGANFLLVAPPSLITTTYSIAPSVTGSVLAGTATFTRSTNTSGFLTVFPTNPGPTLGTVTYVVTATNGSCAPVVIGTVGPICVYPIISGGTLSSTFATLCSGSSATLSLPGFTNLVATAGSCSGTAYSLASNAGTLTGSCGSVTDGIGGSFTNGAAPGTVTITPTNTTNAVQTITYTVTITNGACTPITRTVDVTVVPALNNTGVTVTSNAAPVTNTVCSDNGGGTTITVNNLVCATGYSSGFTSVTVGAPTITVGSGTLTGGTPSSITNAATSASFTIGAFTLTGGCNTGTAVYTITGQNAPCAPITLGTITITVVPKVVGGSISGTTTVCSGTGVTNGIAGNNCANGHLSGTTTYTLSVTSSGANITSTGLPGTLTNTTGTFTVTPTNTGCSNTLNTVTYQIVATNGSPCTAYDMGSFTVTVVPALNNTGVTVTSNAAPVTNTVCSDNAGGTTITVNNLVCATGYGSGFTSVTVGAPTITVGSGTLTGGTPSAVTNAATSASFTIGAFTLTGGCNSGTAVYTITGQNAPCAPITLGTITITVVPKVVGGTISGTTTVCSGTGVTNGIAGNNCANGHLSGTTTYTLSVTSSGANITSTGLPGTLTNTTGTFTVTPTNTGCSNTLNTVTYQIVATNGSPCTAYDMGTFTVTVIPALNNTGVTVTSNAAPVTNTVCSDDAGGTTITVNNLVCATGYGSSFTSVTVGAPTITVGSGTLTGGTPSAVTNAASSASFTIGAFTLTAGCNTGTAVYTITGQNAPCAPITLGTITITVIPKVVGGTIAGTTSVCSGTPVTNTIAGNTCANGHLSGTTQYTLSVSSSGANISSTGLPGSTTNTTGTFTVTPTNFNCANSANTVTYQITASNGSPCTAFSLGTFTVTVLPAPSSGGVMTLSANAPILICSGDLATFATNRCAGATATWEVATSTGGPFGAFVAYGGMTDNGNQTYTTSGLTTVPCVTTVYRFRGTFTNSAGLGSCVVVTTSSNDVSVFPAPTTTTPTITASTGTLITPFFNTDICTAVNSVTVTSPAPACGAITEWQYSLNNGVSWTAIPSTASNILNVSNVPQNTLYRAIISNGALCATIPSSSVSVTVNVVTGGTPTTTTPTICTGSSANITLGGYLGNILFWESDIVSSAFGAASNIASTSPTITVSPTVNTWYRARLASGVCSTYSAVILVTVYQTPTNTLAAAASPICSTTGSVLNLTSALTVNGVTTHRITSDYPAANTDIYNSTTPPNAAFTVPTAFANPNGVTNYTYTVTTAPCAAATATASITVNPASVGGTVSSNATQCTPASGTVTLSGHTGAVTGWELSTNGGGTWTPVANVTTSLTYSAITQTTMYRAVVQSGVCSSANSSAVTITVIGVPTATISAPVTICSTSSTVLTLGSTGGTAGVTTYNVTSNYPSAGSVVYATNTTAPNANLTVPSTYVNPNGATIYTYTVTSAPCSPVSNTATTTVQPASVGGTVSSSATQCDPASGTLTLSGHTGLVTNWELSTNGGATWTPVANTTTTLNYSAITATTMYRAVVQNGVCASANSSAVTITVIPVPTATLTSTATICSTSSTVLSFTSANGVNGLTTYRITSDYPSANSDVYGSNTVAPTSPLTVDPTNVNPNGITNYTYTVTSVPCGVVTASVAVTVQPASVGGTVSSSATQCDPASGTLTLTGNTGAVIRWELSTNGGATWSTVANTTTSLTYAAITTTTMYRAVVQNGVCASANSSAVTITVIPVPTATLTSTATICASTSTVLSFTTSNGVNGLTTYRITSDYPSANSDVYNSNTVAPTSPLTVDPTNVNPNGTTNYTFTVTSVPCGVVTATTAVLVQPISVGGTVSSSATQCDPASGTLTLSGQTGAVIRWELSTNGGATWTTVANTTTTLTYTAIANTTMYRAVVQNGVCASANSSAVTITVIPVPTATLTSTATICASTSTVLSFTTSNGVNGLTTYRITSDYPSANSDVYGSNTVAPTSPLTVDPTNVNPNGTTNYTFTVTSVPCGVVTATTAVLVQPISVGGTVSSSATQCDPASGTLTLSGQTGSVIRWELSTNGGATWTTVANVTSTLNYTAISATTMYRAVVQNGVCASANSSAVTITVIPVPTATLTSTATICASTSTVLSFTTSNGVNGLTTYRITSDYPSANSDVYGSNTVAPTSPLTVDPTNVNPNGTTNYTFTVTSVPCGVVTATTAVLVQPISVGGTVSSSATQCDPASGTLTLSGQTGAVIRWELSTNGGATWTPVANTTATLNYSAISATTMYRAVVQNGVCASANSSSVTITVIPVPTATLTSTATICASTSTVLSFTTSNGVNGLTTYRITSDYPSANSDVYNSNTVAPTSPLTVDPTNVNPNGTTNYTFTVTSVPCGVVTATTAVLVQPISVGGTVSSSATQCDPASGTLTLTGQTGAVIRWELSTNGGTTWSTVVNTTTSLTYSAISATTMYRAVVQNGVCASANSSAVTITVIPVPTATLTSTATICASTSTVLSFTTSNGVNGLTTYRITSDYPSANSDVYGSNTVAPTSPLTVDPTNVNPNGTTNYTFTVTSVPCGVVTATTAVLVQPISVGGTVSSNATQCDPASGTLTLSGQTGAVIRWELSTNGGATWTPVANTTTTLTYTAISATTMYRAVVQNGVCTSANSSAVTITVIPVPTATITSTATICASTSTVLSFTTSNGVNGLTTYRITSDYPSANSDVYSSNTVAPTSPLTVDPTNVNPNGTTNYTFTVTSVPCGVVTATTAVLVQPVSVGGIVSSSATQCEPASGTLTLAGQTGAVIRWEISTNGGTTWSTVVNTTTSLTYTALTATTMYRAVVQNGVCSSANSSAVTITVIKIPTATLTSTATICASTSTVLSFTTSNGTSGLTTYRITSDYPSANSDVYASNLLAPTSPLTVDPTNINPNGTTNYTFTVTSVPCGVVTATTAVLVQPVSVGGTVSSSATQCDPASGTLTLSGQTGLVIRWELSTNGGTTWSTVANTTTSLTYTAITTTTMYRAVVQNGVCSSANSSAVTITVIPVPTATLTSTATICASTSTVLSFTTSNGVSGLTTYRITSDYPSAGSDVYATNTTAPTSPLTVPSTYVNPNGVSNYVFTVTSAPCGAVTASTSVLVQPVSVGGTVSSSATQCSPASGTLTLSGETGLVIRWELSTNGGTTWSTIANTTTSLTYTAITTTTMYRAVVQNGVCSSANSSAVTITVIPVPTATLTSTATICASSSTVLSFTSSNGVSGLTTYRITSDYPTAGSDVYATNTTAPTSPLTVPSTYVNPNGVTNYTYTVTSAPCGAVTATFAVTVYPIPTASITLSPTTICLGSSTTLTISVGNAIGGVTTYAVGTAPGATNIIGTTTISASGSFTTTSSVTPPVGVTTYYLTVITSPCGSVSSNTSVTVNPTTVGGVLSAGSIVCPSTTNSTLFTLSGHTGSVVKWQQSSNDGATWTDINNTLTTYTAINIGVSTLFRAVVQSGVCLVENSATSGVFVNTNPVANFTNTTVCFNTPPTVFTNTTTAGTSLSAAQQILYNITGTVTTTTTYVWNFGDPTSGAANTSTAANPTHAYTTDGTFTATLVATTSTVVGSTTVASCSNTTSKSVTVNQVTTADYTTSPVCLGSPSPVTISNFNSANTYTINWGDATSAQTTTTSTTTRTYANPGQYSVRLRLTNIYGCSDSITKNVTAWALPVATGVSISNTNPCIGSSVTFQPVGDAGGTTFVINPTTGVATAVVANAASITSYAWDFGDGNTANTRVATNNYAIAGTYTVKLLITNSNGCSQLFTFTATPVTVQPIPVANFNNTTVCYGIPTTFTDLATIASGSITNWSWNFGDPASGGNNTFTSGTSANPTHLYTAPGTYTVTLTVSSSFGCTHTTTKQVTVYPLPQVNFTASAISACAGSTITFTSTSTISSGSLTYGWRVSDNAGNFNFASSVISANAPLVQTFATAGTYNIRLYATSSNGCMDSATKSVTIFANPTAVIVVNPGTNQICIYESFTFTSAGSVAGSGTISSYAWTFGDGSTSTAANPAAKSYAFPGNYVVTLTIVNSNGCSNTTTRTVTVNPKPIANFNSSPVCFGYTMNFTDASTTGAGSTFLWNFGDAASGALNTAITQNTSHNYTTAGTFTVKLVVTNSTGCKDSISKVVTVWPRPVANFTADTVCEGNVTTFMNLSTIASGSMSFLWSFGDAANSTSTSTNPTFLYTPGVYSVKLIVTSGFGCIDSVRKSILVKANPKPTFIVANACLRDAITLDTTGTNGSALATLMVDYGDGSAPTTSLTHTYAMSGTYTVTITMTDNGCTSTISKVVTIYDLPLPSFSVSAYTICVNAVDTFSNTSTIASGTIVSNKWEVINAGGTVVSSITYSTNQEFIFSFNTAGVYRVKLTATSDKGCVDTISKIVTVNALPTVSINSINFIAQAFHACLGTPHELTSIGSTAGSGTIAGYFWDFGDGSFSTSQNPIYTYKSVGTFLVTLTITNSNGCTFSKQQSVVVDPIPDATIKPSNFPVQTCNGTPFTFTGPSGAGYNYVWTRNGVVIGNTQSITVNPPTSGWYYLAVTSSFGCTKVDSAFLSVNPLPVITLSKKTVTISKGWHEQVTAFVTGPNPTFTYVWTKQDTNSLADISDPSIPNPLLTPPNNVSTYYFVVTVTDQKGCVQRDTVTFNMLDDYNIKPTNLLTPNNDGINDVFVIQNIETYPDVEVSIFNVWGNVVYQTKNYSANPWNGTYNNTGGELPDGTYFYIIRTGHVTNGNELIYKGHITILRNR